MSFGEMFLKLKDFRKSLVMIALSTASPDRSNYMVGCSKDSQDRLP